MKDLAGFIQDKIIRVGHLSYSGFDHPTFPHKKNLVFGRVGRFFTWVQLDFSRTYVLLYVDSNHFTPRTVRKKYDWRIFREYLVLFRFFQDVLDILIGR